MLAHKYIYENAPVLTNLIGYPLKVTGTAFE